MNTAKLRDLLLTYFSQSEIKNIMFDLGIDYEDLGGGSKSELVLNLVNYLVRRGSIDELIKLIQRERPNIQIEGEHVDIDIGQKVSSSAEGFKSGVIIDEIIESASSEYINKMLNEVDIDVIPLREAKVILVGEGGVGKTSIVKRLRNNEFHSDLQMTEGISIKKWSILIDSDDGEIEVNLNIWDFGGQGVYHATHQLFFTKRSLYLLVVDARQGKEAGLLDYWLKLIQTFGENAPIIVVTNKIDIHPIQLPEQQLKRDYPNIVDFAYTSCESGAGVGKLTKAIQETISTLPHIHDELFASWFNVKKKLEQLREQNKDYISMDRYVEICEDAGVKELEDQKVLLSFLHDLGTVLAFQDDKTTEDTQVLNPDWITSGIYAFLSSKVIKVAEGVLTLDQIDSILDTAKFPTWKHVFILNTMKRFELCIPLGSENDKFLIPDLLPEKEPEIEWDFDDCISLKFVYEILPRSIMTRFIVKMMAQVEPKNTDFWLRGARLDYEDNKAFIAAGKDEITVWVGGLINTRRQFLSIIRAQLKEINRSFPNLEVQEVVPIPKYPEQLITYRELRNLEERKVPMPYYYAAIDDFIDIRELLDGIEMEQERNLTELREKMVQAFSIDELNPGGKEVKILDLIQRMDRRGRIPDLIKLCEKKRPLETW
jgi:internalin A